MAVWSVLKLGTEMLEIRDSHRFRFQGSRTDVDEGAVHGQPTHCFWDC